MERAKTGIEKLDEILEGGFPRPSTVLLIGNVGTNKNTIAQQILWQGLKEGEPGIYITVDAFPSDIVENMRRYGWDVTKCIERGQLVFIDGLSPRVGVTTNARYLIENPFDVDEILSVLVLAERELFSAWDKPGRIVFSHISTILFTLSRKKIAYFIERLHAEARKYNTIFMLVYTEGVRNRYIETFIKQLPDVVICLRKEWVNGKPRRVMWIDRCVKTRYPKEKIPYELTPSGIVLKPEKLETY